MLYFRILVQDMNCVAAIGVVHFSVRGFGCALFYFGKEYEKMRAKKFSAGVAVATAVVIMLTGCGKGEQSSNAANSESSAMSGETSAVSTASSVDSSTGSENVIDSNAADFSYDIGEFDDGSTYAKITGYHGTATDVTLPVTEYQGYNVTVIGTEAFKNSTIKRMVIPEGYIAYEEGAFADCTELEELYLPDSMEDFMKNSYWNPLYDFSNCYKLTKCDFMGTTLDVRNQLLCEDYKGYRDMSIGIFHAVNNDIEVVKKSKNGTFEGTTTIPVYYDGNISGSTDTVKFDLSNVNLDIRGVGEDGNEWTSETFFDSVRNDIVEEMSWHNIPRLSKNGIIYMIIVIKDGECTQVAASAELDITKYKEITDEDYTSDYCIGDAVVGRCFISNN